MPATETYDAIIVGAGICGAVTAWKLALSGARVLLLEAGETGPERVELVGSYARAANKTPGSPYLGRDGDKFAPGPETRADYYRPSDSKMFRSTYLRRAGGSTWHFLGNVPRFLPSDFRLKSTYGVGCNWPLSYDDIEPDYCEAERLMGVSGDHDQWNGLFGAHRSEPYPMTKIWESYSDRRVTPAIESLEADGRPIRVMSTPQARNSQFYDGRPPCAGNSICVPICPIQAKYDGTVHLKKAIAAGVEFRNQAVVTRLELADDGRTIAAVRYSNWDGAERREIARLIVVAAHSIETAKLLLFSSERESGIANSSGQVGRNLMDHPQGAGGCLSPQPLFPFRGPPTTSGIDMFRDGPFRKERAAFRMSLGNDGLGRIETPAATVECLMETDRLFGTALRERARDHLTRQFRISYSTELLPDPENRVTLSGDLDALGVPMPRIQFSVPDYNHLAFEAARNVIGRIFAAIGGTQIVFAPAGNDWTGAGHVMGTCRMGDDPSSSVVDSSGRSHDHPNLFLVGSSVFPTAGTANPTLTALALTLRTCRTLNRGLTTKEPRA
jgi:choline dehydrogenase-like flavoprotein